MSATITAPSGQPGPMQQGDWTPAGQSNVTTWNVKRLAPPSPLYVTVDDVLRISAASSLPNEVVTVNYRLLRAADGKIVYGQDTINVPVNRLLGFQDIPLAEGFLISASVKAAVATRRGQTFARLFLNPKSLGQGQPGLMMMADYVTTAMAPGYPNGRTIAPTEGPGFTSLISLGSPAPGNPWVLAQAVNQRWRVIAGTGTFTASAAALNRTPTLLVELAGVPVFKCAGPTVITAGQTVQVNYAPLFGAPAPASLDALVPMPPELTLATGYVLTDGGAMDIGDAWSNVSFVMEEWMENV